MQENGHGVNEEGLKAYFRWLNEESGYAANTVRNKRQACKRRVRQLYHHASVEERIMIDRVLHDLDHEHDTKAPKTNGSAVTRDKYLTLEEYRQLLAQVKSDRQYCFLQFLWSTGARVSELTGAELRRCDVDETVVRITVRGKGSKERILKVRRDLYNRIRETFRGETYLFETQTGKPYQRDYISHQVQKIGKRIGKRISAHTLRHSFATDKLKRGASLPALSHYLGHSTVAITADFYLHDEMDEELLLEEIA
jgi:integrase